MPSIPNRGNGQIGGFLAHPAFVGTGPKSATRAGRLLGNRRRPFKSAVLATKTRSIVGVTRDSAGSALGNCTVNLFRTGDNAFMGTTVSDAAGNFRFEDAGAGPFFVIAYRVPPDVAGTTVNTLMPV